MSGSKAERSDETRTLLSVLNAQRSHVMGILDGLSDDDLRRPAVPTGWSCLGVVQHLALDVERFWFRAVVAGQSVELKFGDGAWRVDADLPSESVFGLYRDEIRLADAIIENTGLDAMPQRWPDDLGQVLPPRTLRKTVLHVITETACHAGHLDVARELIDGRTWLILTD